MSAGRAPPGQGDSDTGSGSSGNRQSRFAYRVRVEPCERTALSYSQKIEHSKRPLAFTERLYIPHASEIGYDGGLCRIEERMAESNLEFYTRRATEEKHAALGATNPEAASVHHQLSAKYSAYVLHGIPLGVERDEEHMVG
jgi:hypothetical protein